MFKGECVGQVLCFELLQKKLMRRRGARAATVGMDNQASMLAIQDPGLGTGRYLIDKILEGIQRIKKTRSNVDVEIFWTPGH